MALTALTACTDASAFPDAAPVGTNDSGSSTTDASGVDAEAGADTAAGADSTVDDGSSTSPTDDAATPSPTDALRIATWNVEAFPREEETATLVADAITAQGWDLVGVQEIADVAAFDALAEAMPEYEGVRAFEGDGHTRVGLLYRTDRLAVTEIDLLFDDDWYAFPRPVLKVHVAVRDGEFDFVFLVVHLKAQLDEESRARRAAAVEALRDWVGEQLVETEEQDYVIVGDFNDQLDDPVEENVFRPFLEAPETFSVLTEPATAADEYSYIPFRSMIDHMVVTTDVLAEYGTGSTEVLHLEREIDGYRRAVSDHRPVVAEFVGL
jgi:endonuclease/exonuclease/phosphatase family metal-dependent hydrolase